MDVSQRQQFDWRRNLAGVWVAMFAIQLGFGFSAPYVALYLQSDFNIRDSAQLALMTGVVAGSVAVSASVVGPLWGAIGDRYGRRRMLIRAIAGAGITISASGLAPNIASLIATRVALGVSAGVNPAGTAVVVEGTPPARLAWALGVTASAQAIGQSVGPIVGALLASLLPLRVVFIIGGVLLLVVLVPVGRLVHEPVRSITGAEPRLSIRLALQDAAPGTASTIITLCMCLGLVFFAVTGMQQLIVLRILSLHLTFAAFATGITFTVFGIATAVSAVSYSRMVRHLGFKRVAVFSATLLACAICIAAFAPGLPLLVISAVAAGAMFGALFPTLNSMLGLEAPSKIKATIFGFSGSFTALGTGVGPLVGGLVAAVMGLTWGLYVLAAGALVAGVVVGIVGREPTAGSN